MGEGILTELTLQIGGEPKITGQYKILTRLLLRYRVEA